MYPMFVCPGTKVRQEVTSMPGIYQQSVDQIVEECREVESLGIPGIILFGLPESKDPRGASSLSKEGVVQRAIEAIRKAKLKLLVITDVCLCEYTDHGHCGVIENGEVANDATLTILAQQALSHARAGADIVAPSDMMDGRVGAIRAALDHADFTDVSIMAYAAKYASAFYGPFREAVGSLGRLKGDKRGYQTAARLSYHNDNCDVVGLMCLRTAKQGGLSSFTSAIDNRRAAQSGKCRIA